MKKKRIKSKKEKLKNMKKKINYFKFNKGSFLFLISLILFLGSIVSEQIVGSISLIVSLKWISFVLIYLGLITHFMVVGDKPYLKSWNYILDSFNFIKIVIILFFVFTLVGFFVPVPEGLAEKIFEFLEQLFNKTKDMSQFGLIKFIFLNNLQSSFSSLIFGIFFGIFPIIVAVMNGYLLGFVAFLSVSEEGLFVLWRLSPHGIFELPAVFISLGLGLRLGFLAFQTKKLKNFKYYFIDSLRVFVFVVLPLLLFAAIIEGSLLTLFG